MDLSDYESLRPGRQALLPLSWGRALPGEVAQLLLGLGQAANEAGLALQDAQALWARISDVQDRREWLNSSERQAVGSVAEDLFDTTMHYIEELTGIYAVAVARYAACAVETAGRAINQQPILIPTPLAVVPSDILQLAQIHVPLIQIPIEMMPARWQHRAQVENGGLSTGHRLLQAAMQAVRNPPRSFDGPGQLHRANQQVLETEFPSALHAYAADCAISGALVAWATTDQQGSSPHVPASRTRSGWKGGAIEGREDRVGGPRPGRRQWYGGRACRVDINRRGPFVVARPATRIESLGESRRNPNRLVCPHADSGRHRRATRSLANGADGIRGAINGRNRAVGGRGLRRRRRVPGGPPQCGRTAAAAALPSPAAPNTRRSR